MKPIFLIGLFLALVSDVDAQNNVYRVTEYSFKKTLSESLFAETQLHGEGGSESKLDLGVMAKLIRDSRLYIVEEDSTVFVLSFINSKKRCEELSSSHFYGDAINVIKSKNRVLSLDYRIPAYGIMKFEMVKGLGNDSEMIQSIKEECTK